MINEIAHNGQDKMFEDIKRILREISISEARSQIDKRQLSYRIRQYHKAYRIKQAQIKLRIQSQNTKNK